MVGGRGFEVEAALADSRSCSDATEGVDERDALAGALVEFDGEGTAVALMTSLFLRSMSEVRASTFGGT